MNINPSRGQLLIISAPSGAGKTSLIKALVDADDRIEVSVSHTTRPQRPGEKDGKNYFFVSETTFLSLRENGAFFEWAEVFGHHYGTGIAQLEARLAQGADVVLPERFLAFLAERVKCVDAALDATHFAVKAVVDS